jgi:hypothetical protein
MNKALYNKFIVLLTSRLLQTNRFHLGEVDQCMPATCHSDVDIAQSGAAMWHTC